MKFIVVVFRQVTCEASVPPLVPQRLMTGSQCPAAALLAIHSTHRPSRIATLPTRIFEVRAAVVVAFYLEYLRKVPLQNKEFSIAAREKLKEIRQLGSS